MTKNSTLAAAVVAALAFAPAAALADNDHGRGRGKNKDPLSIPIAGMGSLSGERITSGTLKIVGFALDQTGPIPVLNAVGILNATSATHSLINQPVQLPVLPTNSGAAAGRIGIQQLAACSVLALDLGALHLDLLGLVVDLNEVVLDITAQPGAGNLLGNLLCGVLGLLDIPGAIAAITQLVGNLNNLTTLLGTL
jgi:hypothetical protein